ncbi:MAG: hypothetical protein K2H83_04185, partial [Duncaniella sp.]|nr:hypothetical protein [Duncaniella sp.]
MEKRGVFTSDTPTGYNVVNVCTQLFIVRRRNYGRKTEKAGVRSASRHPAPAYPIDVVRLSAGVHLVVVFLVFARGDVVHPFLVVEIPA